MKCKHCDGEGEYVSFYISGVPQVKMCPFCNGTGEVEQTNEEWLRSATFEELAGAIYEWHSAGYTSGRVGLGLNPITEVVEWLKQPHKENE